MDDLLGEDVEVQELIKRFFTETSWSELKEDVKNRYLNMTRNYLEADFMPKPDFMKDLPKIDESKKNKTKRKRCSSNDKSEAKTYPKRNVPKKNYLEKEEPEDDRYIYCDVCEKQYVDFCSKCGMLVTLESTPVPIGTANRAMKTVPREILEIRASNIHGLGVFAVKDLNKGIRLGPYEGHITRIESTRGYSWKLKNGCLIDASDESNSNYLRYVNCARNMTEQNLVAFQYKGNLYYRTCQEIKAGEELLVFYGKSFAINLGIDPKKYFEPPMEDLSSSSVFICQFCHIGLSTKDYRDEHEKRCRFSPRFMHVYEGEGFLCQYCKCIFTSRQYLTSHETHCPIRIKILKEKNASEKDDIRGCSSKKQAEKNKIFNCEKCSFQSRYEGSLKKHSYLHDECPRIKCTFCKKGFNEKKDLDNHILKHHSLMGKHLVSCKIHKCNYCEYETINVSNMKRHQMKHIKRNIKNGIDTNEHDETNADRDADGNVGKKNNEFNENIRNEHLAGLNKYQCNDCNYATFDKSALRRHVLIHTKNYQYKCQYCDKRFSQKVDFDGHIISKHPTAENILISNKVHKCSFCNYKAVRRACLKNHLRVHLKDKNVQKLCS